MLRIFRWERLICAYFTQETLATKPQYILFLGIAHFLPVKPFVAAAHTAPTKATLIRLADTATWACYGKKLQLLGHIPSSTFGAYDY
ncbi:hypothetical protein SE2072C2_23330 [Salmonella enterica]|nr:hypothetical protein SE2072C2_23330 [Salmonella enterica]